MGLGQHIKSFRDRVVEFKVYDREFFDKSYLESLGPLTMPEQGGQAGLERRKRQTKRPLRVAANDLKVRLIGK